MFGMESDKTKNKGADYSFDLEEDLKDPGKLRATKELVAERVQQLKTMLRQGKDKESFDQLQKLLHGYLAAEKVIHRMNRKMF